MNTKWLRGENLDESLLLQILENTSSTVFLWSLPTFQLVYPNYFKTEKLLGYPAELFSKDRDFWRSIIHQEDQSLALQAYNECFVSGRSEAHFRICLTNGSPLMVKGCFRILRQSNDNSEYLLYTVEAFTGIAAIELKQTLSAISKSAILVYTDVNGQIIEANDLFCKISGYSLNEIVGKTHRILKSGHHSKDFFINLWNTIKSGNIWIGEIQNKAKDGSFYWVHTTIAPITDFQGQIIKYIAIRYDITAQKNAEVELRKSEEMWKFAIEGSDDGVWDWDIANNKMTFSHRWKAMLGYGDDEIKNEPNECRSRVHPLDLSDLMTSMQKHLLGDGQYVNEHRMLCKNGEYKWVLQRGKVVERAVNGDPLRMIGTQSDISKNKAVENKLRTQSERLASIFEGSQDAIMLLSDKGFFDCNEQTLKLFEIESKAEFIKYHPSELSPEFQPDGKLSSIKANDQIMIAFHKGVSKFEWVHCRKNGEHFYADVLLSSFNYDGSKVLQATVRDISEKKKLENDFRIQQEQLVASSKMAALGVMASGIAHEINNPLTIIIGFSDMMKMELDAIKNIPVEALDKQLSTIRTTAARISTIVNGLSNYSRNNINDLPQKVVVAEVLLHTLELCKEKYKNRATRIDLDFDKNSLISTMGISAQISEVVLNLLINAHDATEFSDEKWVTLTVGQKDNSVIISVTDSGVGVPTSIASKIMDPFFTTKDPGKGTGLGLSISKKIIENHGGKFYYDPSSSKTRFVLELPIYDFAGTIDGI